jgi:transcriptional regulator with XRE-family HTH domain
VADPVLDLDLLADAIKAQMDARSISLRSAAEEIGCSASTLSRLLQGKAADSTPDTKNLIRTTSWLGKSLSDFTRSTTIPAPTLADVLVHLRALPELDEQDKEHLVTLVKAAHDSLLDRRRAP